MLEIYAEGRKSTWTSSLILEFFREKKMLDTASGGKGAAQQAHHLVLDEQDLAYEEEILRNPNSIKPWIRYIEHKADAPKNILNLVFERALKELPGSYKLWYNYLKVRLCLLVGSNSFFISKTILLISYFSTLYD